MATSAKCSRYGGIDESAMHAVRESSRSKVVWIALGFLNKCEQIFEQEIRA